jgi:ribosomal protein L11 methyltransferase
MIMDYLKITISIPGDAGDKMGDTGDTIRDILIARLSEAGYEGFEEEGALPGGVDHLHAFIPEERFDAGMLDQLLMPWRLVAKRERIAERNWNEEWEKNFEPVVVDGFCGIRAFFHEPAVGVVYDLVITPKMSFGTGHHATTYMMLSAMRRLEFQGRTTLDFGTGTGVLAILAEKLGASDVLAIDHDDWSIENAKENIRENHCDRIAIEKMEVIPRNKLFFIILANINKNIIVDQLGAMEQQLAPEGVILLSGLLQQDMEDIEKKAAHIELTISDRVTKDNWLCLKLERPRGK